MVREFSQTRPLNALFLDGAVSQMSGRLYSLVNPVEHQVSAITVRGMGGAAILLPCGNDLDEPG